MRRTAKHADDFLELTHLAASGRVESRRQFLQFCGIALEAVLQHIAQEVWPLSGAAAHAPVFDHCLEIITIAFSFERLPDGDEFAGIAVTAGLERLRQDR